MSSQCLMNVFGVGSCCCSLCCSVEVVVVVVIIDIDVVADGITGVRSGRFNWCCCVGDDSINKGGCDGDNSSVVGIGDSGSGGAITRKHTEIILYDTLTYFIFLHLYVLEIGNCIIPDLI